MAYTRQESERQAWHATAWEPSLHRIGRLDAVLRGSGHRPVDRRHLFSGSLCRGDQIAVPCHQYYEFHAPLCYDRSHIEAKLKIYTLLLKDRRSACVRSATSQPAEAYSKHGRAAIVVPDNVLLEGGAGETVRRRLLHECDAHTLLRLPTGVFYAQGVKANVLFFDRKPASQTPWTTTLWIYDLRTNRHFTLKTNPLARADLDEFVACCNPENRHDRKEGERFRPFSYEELVKRDKANLDIFWLRDESVEDSASLPPPDVLAEEIVEDLRAALEQFEEIGVDLKLGGSQARAPSRLCRAADPPSPRTMLL